MGFEEGERNRRERRINESKNPYFDTRMEVLETCIGKHINRINNHENNDLIEIHHLFYDEV